MNRQKFNSLSFKKKIEWLLQYYGVTALAVLAAILIIGYLIFSIFGPHPEPVLRVLILDDGVSFEDVEQLRGELEILLGDPVELSAYMPSDPNQMQAFSVRLVGDKLDLVIAPQPQMDEMEKNGLILEKSRIPADGSYRQLTRPEAMEDAFEMNIGITVNKKNDVAIEKAMNYFLN